MTTTYQIAEVARRSGFPATTLRYYEDVGLVAPVDRTAAGYRLYDDQSLARLAFVARAKQLGCTLEEITDLVTAWEGERCEPVQARLRHLVEAKLAESQDRLVEMVAFSAQLREAAAALNDHTPDGHCDNNCGCTAEPASSAPTVVPLTAKLAIADVPPIACTLGAADIPGRFDAWQEALVPVMARTGIDYGVRLTFAPSTSMAEVADLVVAEQACCMFFQFAITVDDRGAALEVTAPADAQEIVYSLFGVAS